MSIKDYALVKKSTLTALAESYRKKTDTTEPMTMEELAVAYDELEVGGGEENPLISVVDGTATEITAEMLEGVTAIKTYGFYKDTKLTKIEIPSAVKKLGSNCFDGATKLAQITFPENHELTWIGSNAFVSNAFTELVIPNVYQLENATVWKCNSLKKLILSEKLVKLNGYTIQSCTSLETVIFKGTIDKNSGATSNTFTGCSNLKNIYVPWAEGEVANAPWGATNATIHYNSEV